mmetsp:Transcript_37100/g.66163  ORF Transcript_37100/g.66163 Transcript_37100/m.66163 type:complete len:97 (+) Transcript_37100:939-1229(+)
MAPTMGCTMDCPLRWKEKVCTVTWYVVEEKVPWPWLPSEDDFWRKFGPYCPDLRGTAHIPMSREVEMARAQAGPEPADAVACPFSGSGTQSQGAGR